MTYQHITVTPIAGAIGAEIGNVDLSKGADAATAEEIRQASAEHLVVFFRDQDLTPGQMMAAADIFGEPGEYPFVKGIEGFPKIVPVIKEPDDKVNFGGLWHSDTTYLHQPPEYSMLYALETPQSGGDTEFANQYLAYERLSDGMRDMLSGLVGVSSSLKGSAAITRADAMERAGKERPKVHESEHPVVRTHPVTGRKALYINGAHTTHFKGLSEAESEPLLGFLYQHQIKAELTCRFQWRNRSLAVWDNRCCQHNAINDYHGKRRVMHRISIGAATPV